MPQSIWKGAISFGLVSIPVRLYSATEEKDISFRQVHRDDGGRIRYKRVCSVDGEEVPYADIAKGYELPDGEMIVLDDEDFANLPISSSRAVEVLSFVPAEQVDAVQLGKAYFCDPTGGDIKPYVLLRDSLEKADKVAIVKVALRQRERLAMLRSRDGVLVLQTLLWPDEVRETRFDFLDQDVTVRPQELAMAESYISALSGDFDAERVLRPLPRGARVGDRGQGRRSRDEGSRRGGAGRPGRSSTSWRRCAAASPRPSRGAARRRRRTRRRRARRSSQGSTKKAAAKKTTKTAAAAKKATKTTKAAKKTTEKKAAARRSA